MNILPPSNNSTARILIVDDEASNIRGLMHLLEGHGYKSCLGLTDPTMAVSKCIDFKPDLLLLDWHMGAMSALDVLRALHETFADTFLPPVIVLTADCDPDTKKLALAAGVSDFLSKPLDHSEVLLRIRNLLRLRHLIEEVESEKGRLEEIVFERTTELHQTIKELKAVQNQVVEQDRMRALAAMAGGVAHDFNNSLMVIRGYSELYGSNKPHPVSEEETMQALDAIALAANDAGEIVRRLREFYQPFIQPEDELQTIALNKLLEESVELTRPKWETQTRAAGLCVSAQFDFVGQPQILAAPSEIRTVVMNLIFNAVDAMPQGGQLVVRSRAEGKNAVIEIEDTGTGMTEVTRARCLEPFYTTKGDRGTGLGLSIIYSVVHRYEGSIGIKSELNKGTCMTVLLPLAQANESPATTASDAVPHHLRILMVDDDPLICSIVSRFLETDEHRVTVAENGCEALEKFNNEDFDLVITDRVMPKMSGDQLATAIRKIKPEAPIILLTGFQTEGAPQDVNLLLNKPATIESLRGALSEAMGPHRHN